VASLTWDGPTPDDLIENILTFSENVRFMLYPLMVKAMAEAELEMKRYISFAVTPTGLARAAGKSTKHRGEKGHRGEPGRILTGTMIDAVSSAVADGGDMVTGMFGWLQDPENYFLYQENGTRTLPAMNALFQAYLAIVEQIRAQVNGVFMKAEAML
jgi:hypothetical protein